MRLLQTLPIFLVYLFHKNQRTYTVENLVDLCQPIRVALRKIDGTRYVTTHFEKAIQSSLQLKRMFIKDYQGNWSLNLENAIENINE